MVQSCCSILSHDALHHCLSSNSSLENSKIKLGQLFCYCRNHKNTSTILLRYCAYSATGNSRVHYLKSGYVIQPIAFQWDAACMGSLPDPSHFFFLQKWVWLVKLDCSIVASFPGPTQLSVACNTVKREEPGVFFHMRMTYSENGKNLPK